MSGEVRSVVVRLSASVASYISGMGKADAATAKVEAGLERLNKKTLSTDQVMGKVGKIGGRLFIGAAAGIAVAEKKAADFNAEMATVYTLSHANTRQQALLAKAAKSVGVNIGYSATASASAEEELIKAGVKLKDILGGGLKGALDLAAAGQTDVGTATEVAASAMTQFKLKGKDVPHIADLLAAGADKALGSVTDLGYGLSQVGTQAHQMGFSIEETVGTLAEFAQSGLTGERGGTVLKQMFLQLAAPTKNAQGYMDKYGVSLYKANGQIKTMPELADNLQRSFKGLTPAARNQALGVIFGSRAIQGANILMKDGEKVNRRWIKSVNDQGFAAHQAAGKMDSLKGDLKKLDAELGNALIDQGGKQGFLRGMTQDARKLIKKFNQLSGAQKGLVGKGFLGAAAVGGALWTANKIFQAAKGTAALYRGLGGMLGRGAAASAGGGAVERAVGSRVFVTNWPPGMVAGGAAGSAAGAGAGAAEGAAVAAASRGATAKMVLGKIAITAASVVLAGQLAQGISSLLNTVLPRNPKEKTSDPLFKPFSQNIPGGGIAGALRNRDSLTTSVHTVAQAKSGGGIDGFGLRSSINLGKLFTGGAWNAIGDDQKRVEKLDTAIANLTSKDKAQGQDEFNQVLAKTGLTAGEVAKALPKTSAALKADPADAAKSARYWDTVSGGSRKAIANLGKYGKTLHTIPKEVRSAVYTPGVKDSISNIKDLARWYHLTPKQVKTAMLLNGYSETQARIVAAGRAFNRLPKQVKTALRADTVKSRFDVAVLQRLYHLTPKQVATVFKVSGAQTVQQAAAAARAALASIPKTVFVDVYGRNHVSHGGPVSGGLKVPQADGGTVIGQRHPYGDKILTHLAPGEEVITNRHGQADRHRGLLKAINAGRFANGGTIPGAVSGGKGTASVIVNFPAPAVYAAAVKAADQIAADAIKTTATAQDLRSVHLDDLHLQQQIRDTQKSLNEHVKKNIKVKEKDKKGHVHKVTKSVTTKKFTVTGLDRTTAQAELADLKAQLAEQRKQNTVQKALADAKAEAVAAQQQARTDAQSTLTGGLDLLSRSAAGASTYVTKMTGDLAKAGTIMARLRGAKVSPILLQQILDHVNSGDIRGAIRFGQALLDQPALMAQLNTSLGSFTQVAGGVANLSTDPRFLGTTAWNPTNQVASVRQVQVTLGVDPSTWTTDITRRVTANVLQAITGGR